MENIENRPAYCVSVVCLHCCSHIYITESHNTSLTPDRCRAGGGGHTAECFPCEKPLCFGTTPTNIFPMLFNQEVKCILGTDTHNYSSRFYKDRRKQSGEISHKHREHASFNLPACLPGFEPGPSCCGTAAQTMEPSSIFFFQLSSS